ncbi:MAG: hypothetical protein ACI97N_000418 [Cognaticolwellia sp.]|jgi:hypothetical protein
MKKYLPTLLFVFLLNIAFGQQKELNYYLPQGITYDESIPTPEEFLGFQIGEWHLTHDQLVFYLKALAAASDRITLEEYARSYEDKPLILLTITSPKNHQNIDAIKAEHAKIANPNESKKLDISKMPTVLYQGYTIHGNEPSGSNAAPLYAYYLAAGEGAEFEEMLENVVVLLDPCYNPDGMHRFSTWVNSHKSLSVNRSTDDKGREYNEAWPQGRTNHYWFDLNRDWLPLQHPESQGRVKKFHEWKPNILTDHHEMGGHSTFFFQPGIPSRTFPLTPQMNQDLTAEIGNYHAKSLNGIGSMYYSKESFDDFYIGKGSTYPDVNGCVGILFEQGSSRGHLKMTKNGVLSFPFTIRNQLTTSISTFQAGYEMREKLLTFQRGFYENALKEAEKDKTKAYVFGDEFDAARVAHFVELLQRHQIEVYRLEEDIKYKGKEFKKEWSFVVPANQPQYRVIKGIFMTITEFNDNLFYDVSTWTMPLAFNIDCGHLKKKPSLGEVVKGDVFPKGKVIGQKSDYAYLFRWDGYYSPRALNEILEAGIIAKVAAKEFSIETADGLQQFSYGTILIPTQIQKMSSAEIFELLSKIAKRDGIDIYAVNTGLTPMGMDLGSRNMKDVKTPKALMVVGDGASVYDAGEVWHLMDKRYDMPITLVQKSDFKQVNLADYNTLILVSGSYGGLPTESIRTWVRNGNTIIGFKSAINWLKSSGLLQANTKVKVKEKDPKVTLERNYENISSINGAEVIGGAIFESEIDLTHPLAYGYHNVNIPIFRRGTQFILPSSNEIATPLRYTEDALLSGYISKANLKTLNSSASILVGGVGRGRVIGFVDNTNFRAFWYGTNKLFANAIFFGQTISSNSVDFVEGEEEAVEEVEEH